MIHTEENDRGLSEALLDMAAKEDAREKDKAKKELNLRRLEIILQHGNEQQKDAAMQELLVMHAWLLSNNTYILFVPYKEYLLTSIICDKIIIIRYDFYLNLIL